MPAALRIGLSGAITLILALPLIPQQRLLISQSHDPLIMIFQLIKEATVGYLLGLLFLILIESAELAGQVVGTLFGFSATELLDPHSNLPHPLMGKVFAFTALLLLFSFDFHHLFFRLFHESLHFFPFKAYPFNEGIAATLIKATTQLFHHALSYAATGLLAFSVLAALFALCARLFSDFPIFWIAFPLQLLIGLCVIGLSFSFFPQILKEAFEEIAFYVRSLFL